MVGRGLLEGGEEGDVVRVRRVDVLQVLADGSFGGDDFVPVGHLSLRPPFTGSPRRKEFGSRRARNAAKTAKRCRPWVGYYCT